MRSMIKPAISVLLFFVFAIARAQTGDGQCTRSIVLRMFPGNQNPRYEFRGIGHPAYPLGVLNKLLNSCPNTREIDLVLDPKATARDMLVAYGAAEKNQFETIKFFLAGPSYYYPLSIGDGTSKPEEK